MKYFPLLAVLLLSSPLAAEPVDFDRALDPGAVLSAAREAAGKMPSVRAVAFSGGIRTVTDSQEISLEPGQTESAYLWMTSTAYRESCENTGPWTGPICREEVMFRDVRRFKVVMVAAIPSAWGRQTFRLRLDVLRRPSLTIEASDRSHSWEYVLPEIYEDVLKVRPVLAAPAAAFLPASLTICSLRGIERDQCVYSCRDGREIRRSVAVPGNDGLPTLACPQIIIPF
jgi:hypothetical protein